ncbi:MAG: long-chain-fatty-acid--CoA ligase [Deltaproteobacteria bacterium]|nr:long-chain-fatty-acid--CoA ligase [Deltaproteobacteria bacterium]MBI3391234.1 long-chain-fatty-acid--CoA ligase [Deltaproteobacteria bacterium]
MNTSNFVSIPAMMFPDQEILVYDTQRRTYGELWERIQRLANALEGIGVRRGDRIAVLQTNSAQYVEAYFAAAALNAVFIPVNYRAKLPELEYMLGAAETKVLLVGDRYVETVRQLLPKLPSVTTCIAMEGEHEGFRHIEPLIAAAAAEFQERETNDDDTTILMYTSGTTALPKGVMLRFNDFTAYVTANVELADGTPRGTSLLCVPLYHIAGATNVMSNLFTGRKLVLLRQFDATEWLHTVAREQVTHAFVVPTMLKQLIDHPDFATCDLSSLQNLSYGGAAMPFPVIRRALEMFPKTVGFVNAFGQTETTSTLTVLGPDDHRLDGSAAEVELRLKRLVSIGRPLPDVEVKVVDDDSHDLPAGEVGEIWVRTPRVMKGYAAKEGASSPLNADGWLPTRDMGWLDSDGYIFLAGRKDDMIIRGGENIAPAEVEAVLYSHPSVEEAAVIGVPDVEWGQRICAVVVTRPEVMLGADDIIEFCRQRLASFKKPEIIHFLPELPKNPMGKILKKDLRKQFGAA